MTNPPTTAPSGRASKASFASRLFGYDVFISFALGSPPRGSQSYASDLARRLRERDLSVFFSEDEAPPGAPLSETLRRALLRSKLLVVIVNRGTLELPRWVRSEVETFRTSCPGRPVIPVCLDGSFDDKALSDAVQPWLKHADSIWLDEQPDSAVRGIATEKLVTRLLTAPHRLKANTLWRIVVAGVGIGLMVLAALAAWQALLATRERDRASALGDQALSRQLAAQSSESLVRDPVRALLLAVESLAATRTSASDGALLGAISSLPITRLAQHDAAFESVAVQPGSNVLLFSDSRGSVFRGSLDRAGFEVVVPPREGLNLYGAVKVVTYSADGLTWAYAGSNRDITVHAGDTIHTIPDGDKIGETTIVYVFGLAFSPDGKSLAWTTTGQSLRVSDLANEKTRLLLEAPVELSAIVFSPDGHWLVAGGDRGFIRAVAVAPEAAVPTFSASAIGTVSKLAFDAAGRHLYAASRGGRIEIFDAANGKPVALKDASDQGALESMAVTPDGRFIVTGHGNGAVLLWSSNEQKSEWTRRVLLRHAGPVRGLAFAQDGRTAVSVGQDGRLFVTLPVDSGRWHKRSGQMPVQTQTASIQGGVPSPDGHWISWLGTVAAKVNRFAFDLSGLSSAKLPQLTVIRAADGQPVVDGADLPADLGESAVSDPVFSADSSLIAVQVSQRMLFWDLAAARPLDAAVALPPGTRLFGAAPDGAGWIAGTDARANAHYFFDSDLSNWVKLSCALAGRALTLAEWRRYVGNDRPYTPLCVG